MTEWQQKQFAELGQCIRGVSYKPENLREASGKKAVTLLRSNNIRGGRLNFRDLQFVDVHTVRADQILQDADIAICMSNGNRALVGKAGQFNSNDDGLQYTVGAFCSIFRPDSEFDLDFVRHQFGSPFYQKQLDRILAGSAINNLTGSDVNTLVALCPQSRAEQSKIAEILSTVDRAIEQTEALIVKQQRIKTGLMQDLLTRGIDEQGNLRSEQTHQFKDSPLGRIPVEWETRTLGTCCDRIVVGLASSTTHAYRTSGVPMIRNQNIRKGFFDDREMLYLDPTFAKSFPNKAARRGDVLTVRTGSNVGDTATVPERYVGSPTFTTLISSPKTDTLDSTFLVYSVLSDIGQSELNRIMVGGGKENLNVGQFVQFRLRLPPVEEQRRSIEMLDATGSDSDSSHRQLEKYKLLKVALMQDLLTGEKRVTALLDADVTEDAIHA